MRFEYADLMHERSMSDGSRAHVLQAQARQLAIPAGTLCGFCSNQPASVVRRGTWWCSACARNDRIVRNHQGGR